MYIYVRICKIQKCISGRSSVSATISIDLYLSTLISIYLPISISIYIYIYPYLSLSLHIYNREIDGRTHVGLDERREKARLGRVLDMYIHLYLQMYLYLYLYLSLSLPL